MTRFSSVIRSSEQDRAAMGAGAGEGRGLHGQLRSNSSSSARQPRSSLVVSLQTWWLSYFMPHYLQQCYLL